MSINWKEPSLIVSAGGIGGALSLVYSITVGNPPATDLLQSIFSYIFLGMGAGYLGVYVIAKTDTSQFTHAFGFAIACGLSWAPIMDASTALIKQNTEQQLKKEVQEISDKGNIEASKAKNASEEELKKISKRAEEYSEELVRIAGSTTNIDTILEINRALESIEGIVSVVNKKDSGLAKESERKILASISSINEKSVAKLDYRAINTNSLDFARRWGSAPWNFTGLQAAMGEIEKDNSGNKALIIMKTRPES